MNLKDRQKNLQKNKELETNNITTCTAVSDPEPLSDSVTIHDRVSISNAVHQNTSKQRLLNGLFLLLFALLYILFHCDMIDAFLSLFFEFGAVFRHIIRFSQELTDDTYGLFIACWIIFIILVFLLALFSGLLKLFSLFSDFIKAHIRKGNLSYSVYSLLIFLIGCGLITTVKLRLPVLFIILFMLYMYIIIDYICLDSAEGYVD